MILPGKTLFSPETPKIAPPPPPVKPEDPEVLEAKRRQRASDAQRKGRASMILTPDSATLGEPTLSQPRAGSTVLG